VSKLKINSSEVSMRARTFSILFATVSFAAIAKEDPQQMLFIPFVECSQTRCDEFILAQGVIDAGAPARLEAIIRTPTNNSKIVVFDSPGGSLAAGLKLGRVIRKNGLDTGVATSYSRHEIGKPEQILTKDAVCFSSCAYAFMGGVSRSLQDDARIGVHQFYGDQELSNEGETQTLVAVLSQYLKAMGIDRDLLDIASTTESTEMAEVPFDYAVKYNLDNQHPILAQWELQATEDGETLVSVNQQKAGSDASTWIAVGRNPLDVRGFMITVKHGLLTEDTHPNIAEQISQMEFLQSNICINRIKCVALSKFVSWNYEKETQTIDAGFLIDAMTLIDLLAIEGDLVFVSGFPNEHYRISPSVELGRFGIKRGLLALNKTDP